MRLTVLRSARRSPASSRRRVSTSMTAMSRVSNRVPAGREIPSRTPAYEVAGVLGVPQGVDEPLLLARPIFQFDRPAGWQVGHRLRPLGCVVSPQISMKNCWSSKSRSCSAPRLR